MSKQVVPMDSTSPFDGIRRTRDDGSEYWSARDLQDLMGYKNWREFEDAIQRAMMACKNSGHEPNLQFGNAHNLLKRGKYATQKQADYHLTRYACYLVAMNSDPRKTEVSSAQTYFAVKTREAEVAQQTPSNHTLTDTFRPRALENLRRVPDGYFSVMGELFKHLYNLEALFNRSLDENAMIEISVGLRWARYAREVLRIPDQHRCKYAHVCEGGRIEQVWAYALHYVTIFDKWLWEIYFPQHFPDYERYRARYIGLPAPKTRKQLPGPIKRSPAVQSSFEWE